MNPDSIQSLFRFNTWANESVREGLLASDDQVLRAPIPGFWFGSIFFILTHILSGETVWLARLRGADRSVRGPSVDDFASAEGLAEAWRKKDADWETWAAAQTPESLATVGNWRRANGQMYALQHWQVATHIAMHSTNHRGHATVAMTQLGIQHGPQDFLDQYSPIPTG
jgi:uncharacterized damage-inducible protein DinB